MRYIAGLLIGLPILLVACGGDSVSKELKDVCTQSDDAATDTIKVRSPESGAEISSPLKLDATVTVGQPVLYLSIVAADGTHISDYPGRPQTGNAVSFQQDVPFGVDEETQACLWVSHQNQDDPPGAIRIPITLLPGGAPRRT